jgi:hypothetical protein
MGSPTPSGLPQTPAMWWWLPNIAFALVGLALVGLGVYDHDNQALVLMGSSTITAAVAHAIGKQSPVP